MNFRISKNTKVLYIDLDDDDEENIRRQILFYKKNVWIIEKNY